MAKPTTRRHVHTRTISSAEPRIKLHPAALRLRRQAAGLSVREFSERLRATGKTRASDSTVRKWDLGLFAVPESAARGIARVLRCTVNDLQREPRLR